MRNLMLNHWRIISRAMSSKVVIRAAPTKARIDDHICVRIEGLDPHQKITVASKIDEAKKIWTSHGYYTATGDGNVDLSQTPSEGGVYKGIDPMGLFWNISASDDPKARLLKRDVWSPIATNLSVLSGHIPATKLWDECHLAQTTVYRYYQPEDVLRIPVREGRIRGTLFMPKGNSNNRYPGIIDLYGTTGGLLEARAALLASHGFVTLALAYFNFEDLPKPLETLEVEYFQEAVNWLDSHVNVIPDNLGVIGISKGGEIALHISTITEKVKAVVAINSYFYHSTIQLTDKGRKIPFVFPDIDLAKKKDEWIILEDSYDKVESKEECYIPVETSDSAEFLLIHGADDRLVLPHNGIRLLQRFWKHGRKNVSLHIYAGAGHIIEPRYTPVCTGALHKVLGQLLYFGGDRALHAQAQTDSWAKILNFFKQKLGPPHSQL